MAYILVRHTNTRDIKAALKEVIEIPKRKENNKKIASNQKRDQPLLRFSESTVFFETGHEAAHINDVKSPAPGHEAGKQTYKTTLFRMLIDKMPG